MSGLVYNSHNNVVLLSGILIKEIYEIEKFEKEKFTTNGDSHKAHRNAFVDGLKNTK